MKARVVIADDSAVYLELLGVALRRVAQVEVVGTACDGCEAVRLVVESEADIALLDIEMPCLDGFGAAHAIRRRRPQTEIVLHTSGVVDACRPRGARLGIPVFDKLHLDQTIDYLADLGGCRAA
ncbi:MAG: hypothetical protein QOE36_1772 [Gaiellaceae bacterium]|jgi:DNA-binding NarL/FixJ family response regulator|nr:hypothetical protein [Gaiellaceae bacterium]